VAEADPPLVDTRPDTESAVPRAVLSIRSSTERSLALDASRRIESIRRPYPPSSTEPDEFRRGEQHHRAQSVAASFGEKHPPASPVFGEVIAVDTRHGSPSATTTLPVVMVPEH
jgi:hypothetical protein